MTSLKDSIYSKLYSASVTKIDVVTPNDLSKQKIIAVVEDTLRFLHQPTNYEYKVFSSKIYCF